MSDNKTLNIEKLFPDEENRKTAKQYLEYKRAGGKNTNNDKDISAEFRELYSQKFYDVIVDSEAKISDEPVRLFLENAGVYSFLDSLFNYLRKPELYRNECKRVIKLYYSALLSILNGFRNNIDKEKNKELIDKYDKLREGNYYGDNSYSILNDVIEGLQCAIVEKNNMMKESQKEGLYYYIIKKMTERDNLDISCVTTNYTDIAQRITKLPDEKFAYLHGKLGLFEELETKHIAEIKKLSNGKIVFPYLLVQSGIKPIISPWQIKEFAKACDWINEADYMIIIGYGVNSDDEHITNILRERVNASKRIKYFIHCDKKEDEEWNRIKDSVTKQLGSAAVIDFYHTSEFKKVMESLK